MENMIITQNRNIAANMRHIYLLEVITSRQAPAMYELNALSSVSSDVVQLGRFTNKDMAIDVRNDIILWNNQNFDWEWHIEYTVPQDNPEYLSTRDGLELPAARRLAGNITMEHKESSSV